MASGTKVANGNIIPSSFVKIDTTADGKVLQCGAGDQVYGIAQPGTRRTPYNGLDDGYAAIAGDNLLVYVFGDKDVMLTLGGTVTRGDRLKSDASGNGVTTTTANDEVGAEAMASGLSGDVIPVMVIGPVRY